MTLRCSKPSSVVEKGSADGCYTMDAKAEVAIKPEKFCCKQPSFLHIISSQLMAQTLNNVVYMN
jgi:hypothetical protein